MATFEPKKINQASLTLAAAAILILSACQTSERPELKPTDSSWQVIESLGNSRIENSRSPYATNLRPGDEIADNSNIVTGSSSHLILSQGDVQLTASGDSSISLTTNMSQSALSHNYGSVRIRLAAAANATKLIATPHLTASGTNAVLELEVDDQESLITVTSGAVVLSTSNGDHHAQLAAGASARLGTRTNGQLEIRPAAGLPFRPSRALTNTPSSKELEKPDDGLKTEALHQIGVGSGHLPPQPNEVTIVPASRPKIKTPEPEKISANRSLDELDMPARPAGATEPFAIDHDEIAAPVQLQEQFDGLTEGLLGNLPTANSESYQGL